MTDPTNVPTYGKSNSMPLLPHIIFTETYQEESKQQQYQEALDEIQNSTGYQLVFAEDAPTTSPGLRAMTDPAEDLDDEDVWFDTNEESPSMKEASGSPQSDKTVVPGDTLEADGGIIIKTWSPMRFDQQCSPGERVVRVSVGVKSEDTGPMLHGSPNAPVSSGSSLTTMVHSPNKATCDLLSPVTEGPKYRSASAFDNHEMGTPAPGSTKTIGKMAHNLHPNSGRPSNLLHRRTSNKISFMPVMPSPLGPGHRTNNLESDFSGLVTPARSRSFTDMSHGEIQTPTQMKTQSQGENAKRLSVTIPALRTPSRSRDLHCAFTPTEEVEGCYSPFDTSAVSDPFIDRRRCLNTPPLFSRAYEHNGTANTAAEEAVVGATTATDTLKPTSYTPIRPKALTPGLIPSAPYYDATSDASTPTLFFTPIRPKAVAAGLPPGAQDQYPTLGASTPWQRTPSTETSASISHPSTTKPFLTSIPKPSQHITWIQTRAAHIANLARTTHRLAFIAPVSSAHVAAIEEFERATDLDALVEERRNLSLQSAGMRALRTNVPGDGVGGGPFPSISDSAAAATPAYGYGGEGDESVEGVPLGVHMAYLERICAVVAAEKAANSGEEAKTKCGVPGEELSAWGKRAVRRAVVRDVSDAVERRVARRRESMGQ